MATFLANEINSTERDIKALANEDTLLLMMFLGRANTRETKWMLCFHVKLGNTCFGHKICVRNKCCARANGETFVSATMCPQQCVLVCQGLNGPNGACPNYVSFKGWKKCRVFFLGRRWINNQRKLNSVWYNTLNWNMIELICCPLRLPKVT